MKSINEFATEYAQDKYLPVQTSQAVKAGANYVLDEIEKVIRSNSTCEKAIFELGKLIIQLKKAKKQVLLKNVHNLIL
jgi:hypothetical protein